jgi:hypothetical protein
VGSFLARSAAAVAKGAAKVQRMHSINPMTKDFEDWK